MSQTFRNLLAVFIAIIPINGFMIWYRLTQSENFSTFDMLAYPMLFGVGSIVLILILNKYLIGDTFTQTFNSENKEYAFVLGTYFLIKIYFRFFPIGKK